MQALLYIVAQTIILILFFFLSLKLSTRWLVKSRILVGLQWALVLSAIVSIFTDLFIIIVMLYRTSSSWLYWVVCLFAWFIQKVSLFFGVVFPICPHAPPSPSGTLLKSWTISRSNTLPKRILVGQCFPIELEFTPSEESLTSYENCIVIDITKNESLLKGRSDSQWFAIDYSYQPKGTFECRTRYPLYPAPYSAQAFDGLYEQVILDTKERSQLSIDVKFLKAGIQFFELMFFIVGKETRQLIGKYKEQFVITRGIFGFYVPSALYMIGVCLFYILQITSLLGGVSVITGILKYIIR